MTNRQTIHDLLARLTEDRHTAEVDSLRRVIAEERARAERCRDEATALREMLDDAIESLELLAPVPPSSAVPTLHPVAVLDELAARNLHHHPNTAPITASAAWEALRAVLGRVADAGGPVMVDAGLVPDEDGWYPHDGTTWPACLATDFVDADTRDQYGKLLQVRHHRSNGIVWGDVIRWRPARTEGGEQ